MRDQQNSGDGTRISRQCMRLAHLHQPVYGLSDDERAARCDAQFEATSALVGMLAESLGDVDLKLAVLCRRLRSDGQPISSSNGKLTLLLAESVRDDISRLSVLANSNGS